MPISNRNNPRPNEPLIGEKLKNKCLCGPLGRITKGRGSRLIALKDIDVGENVRRAPVNWVNPGAKFQLFP